MPVDVSVAAIFRPMSPDLPTPATMTRPVESAISSHGARELVAEALLERRERLALEADDAPPALDDLARRSRAPPRGGTVERSST